MCAPLEKLKRFCVIPQVLKGQIYIKKKNNLDVKVANFFEKWQPTLHVERESSNAVSPSALFIMNRGKHRETVRGNRRGGVLRL